MRSLRIDLRALALVAALFVSIGANGAHQYVMDHPATAAPTIQLDAYMSHPHSMTYFAWTFAVDQKGKPYEWGGTGPGGFDCSGLVYAAFHQAGVTLPRTTFSMLGSGHLVYTSHPKKGDLAFYGSGHVELYVRPGVTFGAQEPGTRIGYHNWSSSWHPTAFYTVR